MNLRDKIESFAREKGIIYGCGSAEPFYEYVDTLSRTVPFVNYRAEERMYPDLTLTGAKGLIAHVYGTGKLVYARDMRRSTGTYRIGAVI